MTADVSKIFTESNRNARFSLVCFTLFVLALSPVLAVFAPRFMAFIPGICGILGFVSLIIEQRRLPQFSRASWLVPFILFAVMGLSALWAIDPDAVISRTIKTGLILLGFVFLFTFLRHVSAASLERFQKVFLWSVVLAGGLMVIDLYTRGLFFNLTHNDGIEPVGTATLSTLNRSVIFTVLSSVLALGVLVHSRSMTVSIKRVLIAAVFVIIAALLVRTESQSVQLAYICAAGVFAMVPFFRLGLLCKGLAVSLIILLFAAPWLAQWMFWHFSPLILDVDWFRTGYAPDRMEIWDFVARRALEQPWFGYGVEATRIIRDFDTAQSFHKGTFVLHPHNFALQIWIEFGVFGIALLSAFLAYILASIERLGEDIKPLGLALFVALISIAATGYGLWQGWWLGTIIYMFCGVFIVQRTCEARHLEGSNA